MAPGASAPSYQETQTLRTYSVCGPCAELIDAGSDPHTLRGKKTARQILGVCLILLAIAVLTLMILPHLLSALWLQ